MQTFPFISLDGGINPQAINTTTNAKRSGAPRDGLSRRPSLLTQQTQQQSRRKTDGLAFLDLL